MITMRRYKGIAGGGGDFGADRRGRFDWPLASSDLERFRLRPLRGQ